MLCITLFTGCLFIPNKHMVLELLILIHILLGISQSAITLRMNNISLLHISSPNASIYLSINSVFKSFMSAIASITAGITLDLILWGTNYIHPSSDITNT